MASYYTNFTYLNKNSSDEGFIVVAFEPDNGFMDTFLGMDQVSEDSADGTHSFLYGTKYNNKASIAITIINADGTDMSLADNRRALKWLTGARTASWLDLYNGETFCYSFLCVATDSQQRKLDGRVVGLQITFSSLTPWAYSAPETVDCSIRKRLSLENGSVLYRNDALSLNISEDGALYTGRDDGVNAFHIDSDGVVYLDEMFRATIDNKSDDLYTYIYLDIDYQNEGCSSLSIINNSIEINGKPEETIITNMSPGEEIQISAKQFIVSSIPNKLFGDNFNFVWPRLKPGYNDFIVDGDGNCAATFTYRYPMKVGDCAMDISTYGGGIACNGCDEVPTYATVRWEDITGVPTGVSWDKVVNTPTTADGYGITDVYTQEEVDAKISDAEPTWDNIANKPTTIAGYGIVDAYTDDEVYNKDEVDEKIEASGGTGSGGSVTIDEDELNAMLEDILV